ncbi:MAG: hypothetical protein O2780_20105 [Proteobacteria bacterium]|nr:hypothetical protein [Pseudomonadota bacterium]
MDSTSSKETRSGVDVCCANCIRASFAVIVGMSKTTVGLPSVRSDDAASAAAILSITTHGTTHGQGLAQRPLISKPTGRHRL